jgi:hypothetical protein
LTTLAETEPEAAEKFVSDPNKAVFLAFNADLQQMVADMKSIDTELERVKMAEMKYEDRVEAPDEPERLQGTTTAVGGRLRPSPY